MRLRLLFIFFVGFLGAFLLQTHIFLSGDVGYLTYVSKLFFAGGDYGKDIFETNPPLILYVYKPIWLLSQSFQFSIALSARLYFFSLILFSFSISFWLLKKIVSSSGLIELMVILYFVLMLMPVYQFGQREHLLLILTLPYFFLAVCRLDNIKINILIAVIIGLMAAIGFSLKPYFLFPLMLLEIYFIIHRKKIMGWVKIESLIVLLFLLIYLSAILLFEPGYIHIVLPLINQFYFTGIAEPLWIILTDPLVIFCAAVMVLYFLIKTEKKSLSTVLMLALTGSMGTFLLTKTSWFYHLIPAEGMACLLLTVLLSACRSFFRSLFLYGALIGCVFFIPVFNTVQMASHQVEEKNQGDIAELIRFLNTLPGERSVTCFSLYTTADCFPLVYDTKSVYTSRYPFFWWLRGMIKQQQANDALLKSVSVDLNKTHTRWVVIDTYSPPLLIGKGFDLISYLSTHSNFEKTWQQYRYLTAKGHYTVYERLL